MAVTVEIIGGPSVEVPWKSNMNGQEALEAAYNAISDKTKLTFSLQYWGSQLGYLVLMINGTYDTDGSSSNPYFYWDILVNGTPATSGIDGIILQDQQKLSFKYDQYIPAANNSVGLSTKFSASLAQ